MRIKTKVFLFKIWAELLLIACNLTIWIVKIKDPQLMPLGAPILFTAIVALYFWGLYIERRETRHYY